MQGLFTESPPTAWKTTQVLQSLEKHHTGLAEGLRGFLDSVGGFENRRGVCVRISWRNWTYDRQFWRAGHMKKSKNEKFEFFRFFFRSKKIENFHWKVYEKWKNRDRKKKRFSFWHSFAPNKRFSSKLCAKLYVFPLRRRWRRWESTIRSAKTRNTD